MQNVHRTIEDAARCDDADMLASDDPAWASSYRRPATGPETLRVLIFNTMPSCAEETGRVIYHLRSQCGLRTW